MAGTYDFREADRIVAMDYLSTETLQTMALEWPTYWEASKDSAFSWVWQFISTTRHEAAEFYKDMLAEDEDEARALAAEALALAGWTVQAINFRNS